MGAPVRRSIHLKGPVVGAGFEKRHDYDAFSKDDSESAITSSSRSSSYDSLDGIIMGKVLMARKSSSYKSRPKMHKRQKTPSSPLANVVVLEEIKDDEEGESGYGSAKESQDSQEKNRDSVSTTFTEKDSPIVTCEISDTHDFAYLFPVITSPTKSFAAFPNARTFKPPASITMPSVADGSQNFFQ